MAEVRKFDELGAGDGLCGRLPQFGIIAELGSKLGRRQILAYGRGVSFCPIMSKVGTETSPNRYSTGCVMIMS